MPVMPKPVAMVGQAVPNLVMTVSIGAMLFLGSFTPLGIPFWAAGVFVPTVILALLSNEPARQPWRNGALINLATMAIVFPVLVVRQSVVRIPFVDGGNGTLLPPLIATVTIVLLLAALAGACAVLSQEDPEYAGIIFLPAAMMVPLLAGQSDLVSLSSGLLIALTIFGVSAVLTVVATMLPPAYASVVTPATIAIEFIALTMFHSSSIFPIGFGITAKLLFFVVVASTVALAILAPMISVWVRQVTRLARIQSPA